MPTPEGRHPISISTDSKEKADDLFAKLAAGGDVKMPLADTFWGDCLGMLTNQFGINWMMGYHESLPGHP